MRTYADMGSMVNEEPKCVQWKRLGAARIRKELEGFTPAEELEYWHKKTEELKIEQREAKAQLAANSIQSIPDVDDNSELSNESLSRSEVNTVIPEIQDQSRVLTQGVRLHSMSSRKETTLPSLPDNVEAELAAMSNLLDETLWILARNTLSHKDQESLSMLSQEAKIRSITYQEQEEYDRLLGLCDRTMLRRAQAASLLGKRGYDMSDPTVIRNEP